MSEHHTPDDSSIVKEELTDRAAANNGHLALLGCGGHFGKNCFTFLGKRQSCKTDGACKARICFQGGTVIIITTPW